MSEPTVSVPANVTLSVYAVLAWIGRLDTVIAVELDAGRPHVADLVRGIRNDLAEYANLTRLLEEAPK